MKTGCEAKTADSPAEGSETLRRKLTEEVQLGLRLRNKYLGAAVLALYWEVADHVDYKKEAVDVVELFKSKFNFHAEAYPIPSTKSQIALSRKIIEFIQIHDAQENLLVIHYGGHGDENADRGLDDERRSVWAA